ncbi:MULTISPECIES: ATP-binding protein [Bacillaceae]|uniref:ATP-binding protein n=1 Tax=Bacillaceae TaxID=186817 RepID=UPI001C586F55|nr:MoxR family ATPase [Rossellomorea sp. YZS02]MBW3114373.1 MoxR family ATPase [Bacillus sp. MCCB 382]MDX8346313.1 MoxR family ATPase [Rossellomorea sp. YZS02]
MNQDISLPETVTHTINQRKQAFASTDHPSLIGEGGYTASEQYIIEDSIIALSLGKNLLLKGPTGSGKTKLSDTLSSIFSQPMHSINCSVDLDAEALLGYKTISEKDGKSTIEFIEGPVISAMKNGHLLYIDEINMAKPETLPILNGVLDYRRSITNPFTGEVIKAAPSFGVVAAINEGYVGTVPLNEALKNRFVVIDVPYIEGETLKSVIENQSKLTDTKLISQFVSLSSDLLIQVKNGQISEESASIRALLDACDLALYLPAKRAIQRGIVDKLEDEREKAAILNIAETIFE